MKSRKTAVFNLDIYNLVKDFPNKMIVCDECEHEFNLKAINIQKAQVQLSGVMVDLIYFVCPKCNRIYRISIQDKRYYELAEDLKNTKNRIRKNYGINPKLSESLSNSANIKQERLTAYVKKVNETFAGTFTFMASENNQKEKSIIYLP